MTNMELQSDCVCWAFINESVWAAVTIFAGKNQAVALVMQQQLMSSYNNTCHATNYQERSAKLHCYVSLRNSC